MSSSPKYAPVQINTALQRQVAEKNRQREEGQRRREEDARQRRMESARRTGRNRIGAVGSQAKDLAIEARQGLPGRQDLQEALRVFSSRLDRLNRRLNEATDEDALGVVARDIAHAEREAVSLKADIRTAIGAVHRRKTLATLVALTTGVDREEALRFDPQGADSAVAELRCLGSHLTAGELAKFDRDVETAGATVRRHLLTVTAARDAWEEERRAAEEAVVELSQAWEALEADAARLGVADLDGPVPGALKAARAALATGNPRRARELTLALAEPLAATARNLDQRLSDLERRLVIAKAVQDASSELGMEVSEVLPQPDGRLLFYLQRPNGEEVAGLVTSDGKGGDRLVWRSDSLESTEVLVNGQVERHCELARSLELLHERMSPHGADVGPLDYEGRPGGDKKGQAIAAMPLRGAESAAGHGAP
jgi:hypothetical protein